MTKKCCIWRSTTKPTLLPRPSFGPNIKPTGRMTRRLGLTGRGCSWEARLHRQRFPEQPWILLYSACCPIEQTAEMGQLRWRPIPPRLVENVRLKDLPLFEPISTGQFHE